MNIYTIYADIIESSNPKQFVTNMKNFLNALPTLQSYRITRMKLGFRSMDMPEFRSDGEFKNMTQLDNAMSSVVSNEKNIESDHVGFNQLVDVETIQHFLYRDFPDNLTEHREALNDNKQN